MASQGSSPNILSLLLLLITVHLYDLQPVLPLPFHSALASVETLLLPPPSPRPHHLDPYFYPVSKRKRTRTSHVQPQISSDSDVDPDNVKKVTSRVSQVVNDTSQYSEDSSMTPDKDLYNVSAKISARVWFYCFAFVLS
jgi:hypothetical protein